MEVVDFILDGLDAALELERELGVRSVEIDRSLLAEAARAGRETGDERRETKVERDTGSAKRETKDLRQETTAKADLVFLHDRPLSPGGVEMVAKIITALGRTADNTPVVIAPPIPKAKIYVFLGFAALRKYMPSLKIEENTWGKSPKGKDILVVRDPEEILRFSSVTPAVQKIKQDMWRSLKAVVQRLKG